MSNRSNVATSDVGSNASNTRRRANKRDEAIRKKIENELLRKRPGNRRGQAQQQSATKSKAKQGTVSALRPLPALTVPYNITVSDASQLCAAKRTDCVLVVDNEEHLCGIFTAKDLAFRVTGDNLDPRLTLVSDIMTENPLVTRDTTSATEALQTMVSRGFRHLPVCNEEGDVVGLLDITKVFQESLEKLEKAYGSSQRLYSALEGAQEQLGGEANPLLAYVQALRDRMSFPDLGSILDARTAPATVGVKTSVREAAKLMKERRTTAVCVLDDTGRMAGIFTSKDVVLRVIAAGLDARTCSVVRVMTPHPDVALPSLSIQEALRKMHDGHYLNLPIVDETDALIGIVDVLKLTYATLEQVGSMGGGESTDGGPLWSRFFSAIDGAGSVDDAESALSGSVPGTPAKQMHSVLDTPASDVYPGDSASVVFLDAPDDGTYLFKFAAPGGATHRFQAQYASLEFLVEIVARKLANDPFFAGAAEEATDAAAGTSAEVAVPSPTDFKLSYRDDDGDLVIITTDADLRDAVALAKKQHRDRVVLTLTGGRSWGAEKPASRAPAMNDIQEEDEEPRPVSKTPSQGVSNDQLLPAAIFFLGISILAVFAMSRSRH